MRPNDKNMRTIFESRFKITPTVQVDYSTKYLIDAFTI